MNQHRFILQPYKGPSSRYTCPQCEKPRTFVRYVDTEGEIDLPDFVGRCGREANCTYHYTPKQLFTDYPEYKPGKTETVTPQMYTHIKPVPAVAAPSLIDEEVVQNSLSRYERNNLLLYLCQRLGEAKAYELADTYQIGTSNNWRKQGATVFWQRDEQGQVRGGKVMLYDPATGKRCKEEGYKPTWVHSLLKLPDFTLSQCLFGLHQLPARPADVVAIVESEKTALIATAHFPRCIWLATGGLSNLNVDRCKPLAARKVILYPDLSTDGSVYAKWSQKAKELASIPGLQITISSYLEERATDEQRAAGLDLADFLLTLPATVEEQPVSNISTGCLPDWYTAFNLPWSWDGSAQLSRIQWMTLPLAIEEGSPEDKAPKPGQPVTTLADWATYPGSVLRPDLAQLQYL